MNALGKVSLASGSEFKVHYSYRTELVSELISLLGCKALNPRSKFDLPNMILARSFKSCFRKVYDSSPAQVGEEKN